MARAGSHPRLLTVRSCFAEEAMWQGYKSYYRKVYHGSSEVSWPGCDPSNSSNTDGADTPSMKYATLHGMLGYMTIL